MCRQSNGTYCSVLLHRELIIYSFPDTLLLWMYVRIRNGLLHTKEYKPNFNCGSCGRVLNLICIFSLHFTSVIRIVIYLPRKCMSRSVLKIECCVRNPFYHLYTVMAREDRPNNPPSNSCHTNDKFT